MIKILTTDQIRKADQETLKGESISSRQLMRRACDALFIWIGERYDKTHRFVFFCGPGNNGGDGICLSMLMKQAGYTCVVYYSSVKELSEDGRFYLPEARAAGVEVVPVGGIKDLKPVLATDVLVDALFGSGLSRSIEDPFKDIIQWMNHTQNEIVSIDMPSGLLMDKKPGVEGLSIIKANYTLCFQQPRISLFLPEYQSFVGEWVVLPIGLDPDYLDRVETDYYLLETGDLKKKIRLRKKFDHKGRFGHGFLIAGSYGKMGAAVISAEGALRSGIGLLTVHVPKLGYDIIQHAVPEAMASVDKYDKLISKIPGCDNYTAVGIGPGIGKSPFTVGAIRDLFERCHCPLVLDADALNILSEQPEMLEMLPNDSVITPHIKEFDRLVGECTSHFDRIQKQKDFARKYGVVVVLKGSYTSIVGPEGVCYFNPSGNPGLAKGGSGDLLTGMVLAFLSQGYCSLDSALLAVYLHGLAADLAIEDISVESLLPTDVSMYISDAFLYLKA
jgi:ADP-dependent NAD(P)H-hydrate dehydratase / NAD(P)H-hydrate epimerase